MHCPRVLLLLLLVLCSYSAASGKLQDAEGSCMLLKNRLLLPLPVPDFAYTMVRT